MRICFLNNDLNPQTGSGRFYLALIKAATELSHDNFDYTVLVKDDCFPKNKLKLFKSFFRVRSVFKKCDIIHALDGWPYGVIATVFSLGLGKKIVITAIGTGAVQPLYQPIKKQLLMWACKKADKVTAISNNTKREILKVIPDLRIDVINHGVDFEKFQITNPPAGRAGYQLPITHFKPYILSVGTLKKRKGYEYSIKAFAQIAPKFPNLKYVIVGEGPEKENIQFLISNFQLQNRIIFLNDLSEEKLVGLYRNAELFILLSQDIDKDIEGFGLVFLEAAACGLPVIASKGASAEDAVLDNKNGILVSPSDHLEAADAIVKILSNRDLMDLFSEESIRLARFMNWPRAANSYLEIYKNLL